MEELVRASASAGDLGEGSFNGKWASNSIHPPVAGAAAAAPPAVMWGVFLVLFSSSLFLLPTHRSILNLPTPTFTPNPKSQPHINPYLQPLHHH
jgi:hypothetical protein